MTTLVLTTDVPHRPAGGAALRNWQNIQALRLLGPVDVMSIGVDVPAERVPGVREWIPAPLRRRVVPDRIRTACWLLRSGAYPGLDLYYCREVAQQLRRRLGRERYEVAVIENMPPALYLCELKRAGCRVVFDAHNAEASLQRAVLASRRGPNAPFVRRLKDRVLLARLSDAERRLVRGADVVWACSDADAAELQRSHGAPRKLVVVPNAVDLDAYRNDGGAALDEDWTATPITLVYPGLFSYPPNEDAALRLVRDVLPAIQARGYDARAVLVGRDPTPALRALALSRADVEVTGAVDSVLPYLAGRCVVALPITLGSGTRLKILEAFAAGRPVVTTEKGAEGIDARDGEHLLIRHSGAAMAEAVIDVWNTPSLRRELASAARALVGARYSWSVAARCIAESLRFGPEPVDPSRVRRAEAARRAVAPRATERGVHHEA